MSLSLGNRALNRVAALLLTGVLTACLSLASTLPAPKGGEEAGPAGLLPSMMDASSSYMDTGAATPAAPAAAAPVPAGMQTRVASGEFSPAAARPANNTPGRPDCPTPEPLSVVLMSGGLLGLFAVRRFKR